MLYAYPIFRKLTSPICRRIFESLEHYQTLLLDGASGSYASTPDSVANSVTGDMTLIWGGSFDDWTPSGNTSLIAKYNTTGDERSYRLWVNTSGALAFTISTDGTFNAGDDIASSASVSFVDGSRHWVRVTWDASAQTVDFYTSDDHEATSLDDITWTALGTQQSTASTSVYDSAEPLEMGSNNSGVGNRLSGTTHRAVVINSTDPTGSPVVDFDPREYVTGSTFNAVTGETWTLNGNAEVINA